MKKIIEAGSPYEIIKAGAIDSEHMEISYPADDNPVKRRTCYSLHALTKEDMAKKGMSLPRAMLDPRDSDCRPGIETLVYAYKFATNNDYVLAIPRPKIKINARGLISSSDSPAVLWADGQKIYAFNGIWINPIVYEQPNKITLKMIAEARSAEIRRCMMEHYPGGVLKLIKAWQDKKQITIVDQDRDAMGPRILFSFSDIERYVMVTTVDVSNNEKFYLLRVNPLINKCQAAVASTFPMPAGFIYAPQMES